MLKQVLKYTHYTMPCKISYFVIKKTKIVHLLYFTGVNINFHLLQLLNLSQCRVNIFKIKMIFYWRPFKLKMSNCLISYEIFY